MAEITLNRVGELLRIVLELLWNKPEGLAAREILAFLPGITPLSEYEKGYAPPSNVPRYERIVRLATIPLQRAGWLTKNNKGRWYITDAGRTACRNFPNAQELYREADRLYEESRQILPASGMAIEEAEEKAWEHFHTFLEEKDRYEFQQMVADLLVALGYHVTWSAPPEKVRGQVDIVAHVDPLGAKGPRILVQVKHKSGPLGMESVKSFLSILGPNDYGVLVSSGGFTLEVKAQAASTELQKTTLLDLETIFDLWLACYQRLDEAARGRLPLKPVYFLKGME